MVDMWYLVGSPFVLKLSVLLKRRSLGFGITFLFVADGVVHTNFVALRKQAYSNILKILPPKMKIFR